MLKSVAEFIVCGDQPLSMVDKAVFQNCLVAIWPKATKADIPSTHDIYMYIHNTFGEFIKELRSEIQVHLFYYLST
ncbi:hypothetical protein SCLCIDRAFT_27578 [Scleroderma citrinum Foug A]|uniref:Uncharacterized protein n=1 Tax=Scleroderma citrinum Foug A TaxID=1036808 RepID=A0A0C3DSI9_9AGAM|nr:hypothetical protein SCLCIDRAFT_27578 [Scleroderma citrinum Foug A]